MNKLKVSWVDDALKYLPKILRKITVELVLTLQIQQETFSSASKTTSKDSAVLQNSQITVVYQNLLFLSLIPTVFFLLIFLKWSLPFQIYIQETIDFSIALVPKLAFSLIISSQKDIQYALQHFSRKAVRDLMRKNFLE